MQEIKEEEDIIKKHIRVRNLLTSVALAMGHYTLLDRLSNAVSIDAVQKAVYEASRISAALIGSKEKKLEQIIKEETKDKEKEQKPYIKVDIDDKSYYEFYGSLPSSTDIDQFLTDCMKNIRISRIIGASAMGHVMYVSEFGKRSKQGSSVIVGGARES